LQRGQVEVLYVARPFPSIAFGKGSGYVRLTEKYLGLKKIINGA